MPRCRGAMVATSLTSAHVKPSRVAVILGLAWINTKGVGRAGMFQLLVTICKVVGLLLLLAAIALSSHSPTEQTLLPSTNHDSSPLAYGGALLAVMATYNGWANAAIIGGEVRDAERTIPWELSPESLS